MPFLRNIVKDLVEKRLWPIAVLLVGALVAAPVMLGRSSGETASTEPAPVVADAGASGETQTASRAVVSVDEGSQERRHDGGDVRDPFKAVKAKKKATTAATAPAAPATAGTVVTPPSTGTGSAGTDTGAGSTGSGSTGSGSAGGSTTTPKPMPKPTTTKPQAEDVQDTYHVDLDFGVNGAEPKAIEDVARLSPLPSVTDPFFVYLGVLETKAHVKRAVFLVSSDATPNGEGTCHPTESDCESVELEVGETAFFDYVAPDGTPTQYQLQLTKIVKTEIKAHAKAAAAIARHSNAGAELLRDAAVRNVRAAAGARTYRFVPAVGMLVRAKRRHVSAKAAAAGELVPGLALLSRKHQPGIPVWHSPEPKK
jgi:hypothetical protein